MVVCKMALTGDIGLAGGIQYVGDGVGLGGKACSMGMDCVELAGVW